PRVERICVFCGASPGARPEYRDATAELARLLVREGIGVVYGGGGVGLMGALADAVITAGGEVTGVIPRALVDREIAHRDVIDMRVVGSMHERKALMADLADAFIALPGGLGTLEELFEVYTWAQLGLHQKPCGLLNVEGYYDAMAEFLAHAVDERFVREEHRELLMIETAPSTLLHRLRQFEPDSAVPKWIDREET
ncbi:MAG TPA: TIGR00730 family Rossman fold protein, partial [Thermoleophilaceae bacterium]|nr:TIGR00730 family Rossman fold protein [Thermoleophilaceae bacterium]